MPAASAVSVQSVTAAILGRRVRFRTWSAATRRAMENSQVRTDERPAKSGRERSARRNVSCVRSSMSASLINERRNRATSNWVARIRAVAASV